MFVYNKGQNYFKNLQISILFGKGNIMDGITSMLKILDIILDTLHAKKRNLKPKKLNNPNDTVKTAKKCGSRGSFTVESALIVPVLLFIMYLTIWGMFLCIKRLYLRRLHIRLPGRGPSCGAGV